MSHVMMWWIENSARNQICYSSLTVLLLLLFSMAALILNENHTRTTFKVIAMFVIKPPRLAVSIIDIIVTCLPSEMVSSGRGYSGLKRALDKLSASKWQAHVSRLDLPTRAWKYHHLPSSPDQAMPHWEQKRNRFPKGCWEISSAARQPQLQR